MSKAANDDYQLGCWDLASSFVQQPLDVDHWLRERMPDDFDDEFIGLLATPPPALDELGRSLSAEYEFLRELTPDERKLASCHGRDRTLLLRMLAKLPGTNMPHGSCW